MNREIKTDLYNILDLIAVSADYGFDRSILMDGLFEMIGYNLTQEEIEGYSSLYLTEEYKSKGYTEDDYNSIKEILTEKAKKYNKTTPS